MKTIKILIVTAILTCGIIVSTHNTTKDKEATGDMIITITDPGVGGGGS